MICNNDTILVAEWMIDEGVVLDPEWQLPMAWLSSAHCTREITQFSLYNGGLSGSCLACWCCTFILADSYFKNKIIDINLFRYDVLLGCHAITMPHNTLSNSFNCLPHMLNLAAIFENAFVLLAHMRHYPPGNMMLYESSMCNIVLIELVMLLNI